VIDRVTAHRSNQCQTRVSSGLILPPRLKVIGNTLYLIMLADPSNGPPDTLINLYYCGTSVSDGSLPYNLASAASFLVETVSHVFQLHSLQSFCKCNDSTLSPNCFNQPDSISLAFAYSHGPHLFRQSLPVSRPALCTFPYPQFWLCQAFSQTGSS